MSLIDLVVFLLVIQHARSKLNRLLTNHDKQGDFLNPLRNNLTIQKNLTPEVAENDSKIFDF